MRSPLFSASKVCLTAWLLGLPLDLKSNPCPFGSPLRCTIKLFQSEYFVRISVWLFFTSLLVVTLAYCGWLWPLSHLIEELLRGKPLPALSVWAFSYWPWFPIVSAPWLLAR